MTLGPALIATRGHAAPEVAQTYARAHVLCHQVPESSHLAQTLVGLCLFHTVQGDHRTAQEMGEAPPPTGPTPRRRQRPPDAHGRAGLTALYLGDLVSGRVHLEQGIALYDHLTHRPLALNSLLHFGVVCRIGAGMDPATTRLSRPGPPAGPGGAGPDPGARLALQSL